MNLCYLVQVDSIDSIAYWGTPYRTTMANDSILMGSRKAMKHLDIFGWYGKSVPVLFWDHISQQIQDQVLGRLMASTRHLGSLWFKFMIDLFQSELCSKPLFWSH